MLRYRARVIIAGTRGGAGTKGDPPGAGGSTAKGETKIYITPGALHQYSFLAPSRFRLAVSLANLKGVLSQLTRTSVTRSQVNDLVQMLHDLTTSLELEAAAGT